MREQRKKRQDGKKGDKSGSGALAEGGQVDQWRYTGQKSPRRKSQCYKQGSSSRSESCQEF